MSRPLSVILALVLLASGIFVGWRRASVGRQSTARSPHAAPPQPSPVPQPKVAAQPVSYSPPAQGSDAIDDSTCIAMRFDKAQVFFPASPDNAYIDVGWDRIKDLHELPAPAVDRLEGVWVADHEIVYEHHDLYDRAHPGEEFQLEVSPNLRIAVIVEEPVVAGVVGNPVAGFLAEVAEPNQPEFAASPRNYFIVHKSAATENAAAKRPASVGELPGWKPTPQLRAQIERAVNDRMRDELASLHDFAYRDESNDAKYPELKEKFQKWRQLDEKLARGEATLSYDVQAFQLTPDATPRLFIRARWMVGSDQAFLMSAWLRIHPEVVVEAADPSHSNLLRMFDSDAYTQDLEPLGTVLNVFDPNGNGHGEVLILKQGWEGFGITLFRYTEAGPVAADVSFGGSA
jgi:hypothetical protein